MRMTPVLLFFCLLGLSSAETPARKVRWCVTSDVEDKKCNDLARSDCLINDISLICVKKSSTEDCMRAISNGEADATSLDSINIYKASLPPYNLKPILAESFHSRKSQETPCLKARLKALSGGQPLLGAFVPDCDEKGSYRSKQCHGSTGYCWCVRENGEEIPGTKTPSGQAELKCGEAAKETPCLKARQSAMSAGHPMPGAFVPDCDENGSYRPKQCHGSTGYCWCVRENGDEITGSRTRQADLTCGEHAQEKPCLKARLKALSGGKPMPGAFVPDCDEKGSYRSKQCHGSTGYCWCVRENGEEIPDSKTPPGQAELTCGEPAIQGPCEKERQRLQGKKEQPVLGAFLPKCDEKGHYLTKQCHGSTGYCWCVNEEGKEIDGTKTPPGKSPPCTEHQKSTRCLRQRHSVLSKKKTNVEPYVPECDEKGEYRPKQCQGSTGYCWCVDANGDEIEGRRAQPGTPPLICEAQEKPCLKARQKALSGGKPVLGAFTPDCDEEGLYRPKQCHGSTGYCWCVHENGDEILGSRTRQADLICGEAAAKPCTKERQKAFSGGRPLLGAFVPQCDEKGKYKSRQCHGSTGYCWCVTTDGKEIPGTRTTPLQSPPTCEVTDRMTVRYAVAVVKKTSTLQFNQLKGKRSCHSSVKESAGWIAPLYAFLKNNLLQWKGPEDKSIEKVASEFFSASCAPGATQENLCRQCAGGKDKCKCSPGEPYHGDEGALRCLKDDKGDVAFVAHTALAGHDSDNFELLCRDNTRSSLSDYKECNLGKVPSPAVVTRKTGDKTKDITEYLIEAQKKSCKLFSSTHGEDSLFDHTTASLVPLPSAMDMSMFLGPELFNAMKTLHGAPLPSDNEVRWCAQNTAEKKKCDTWSAVSGGAIKCVEASSPQQCIQKILEGEADAVSLSAQHMYTALKCGLVPAVDGYRNKDDFKPCLTNGKDYTDFGAVRAVAVVKKKDKDLTWNNLKGKKSCHTGVGDQAGWIIPLSLISKHTKNCDLGSFFNKSCAPGSDINSNLCKLCIGDSQKTKTITKCSASNKEAYYGNEGAIRCLVEKGDVAFVPSTAVTANTDGKNPAPWAKDLKSSDFELLCPDGSRAPVTDEKKCNLLGVPLQAVLTREDSVGKVVRITLNQQSLYGRSGFQKDIFQMFSSSNGHNLLFDDDVQCLIEFDRIHEKPIIEDAMGKRYPEALLIDNQCFPIPDLASVCDFHH
ncbi:saxiphilin-like [Leptodactylus fuscus]|uniref:saxiphilin-like n=1 Tax=Leptodactylus fuscus TaxID=238119 RepID=UPI003F4EF996